MVQSDDEDVNHDLIQDNTEYNISDVHLKKIVKFLRLINEIVLDSITPTTGPSNQFHSPDLLIEYLLIYQAPFAPTFTPF